MALIKQMITRLLETPLLSEKEKIAAVAAIMEERAADANILSLLIEPRDPCDDTFDDLARLAREFITRNDKVGLTNEEYRAASQSFVDFMASLAWLVISKKAVLTVEEQEHVNVIIDVLDIEDEN